MARRNLFDRRVIITGASSGIGRALAMELAQFRTRQVLVARREAALEEVAEAVMQRGGVAVVVAGDIVDPTVRAAAIEAASSHFGGLDVLVNNAGVTAHGRFADASPERLQRIFAVNFTATAELMRGAIPLLAAGHDPAVVNIASILGHRGIPHNSEYCASKFAIRGLSEAVRPELARLGIGLLIVSPATTETDFFDHAIERAEPLPWGNLRGLTAAQVATATRVALERHRHEIVPGVRGKIIVWINRLAPRLVDAWMNRYG